MLNMDRTTKLLNWEDIIVTDEFKGNSGGQKDNSIAADPQKKVFDILSDISLKNRGKILHLQDESALSPGFKYMLSLSNDCYRQILCYPAGCLCHGEATKE